MVPLVRKATHEQAAVKVERPCGEALRVRIECTMLRLNFHRHHFPLEHPQLQSFQFISAKRTGKAAVAFSEEFRYFIKRAEARRMAPLSRCVSRKMHIGFAIVADYIHGKTILAFAHLKSSMVMHARKKATSEQLDQPLVRFATPNKDPGPHAIATRVSDGDPMRHVFAREAQRAGDAVRSQVLQPD